MTGRGCALADAAEQLVGCSFKLYGRDPISGVDCVGLLLCSLRAIGAPILEPEQYSLRNLSVEAQVECAPALGLEEASGRSRTGDVLLFQLATSQYHLGIVSTGQGLIHAHAGLRRVVISPTLTSWPIHRSWRLASA